MNARRCLLLLMLLLVAAAGHAAAPSTGSGQALRAYLDRDHANLGDTVTLNIEGVDASATPDLAPLAADFDVLGTSSSSSVQIVNGRARTSSQLGIALRPKRAGVLTIPPLRVGGAMTQPLMLTVTSAPSGGAQGGPDDDAFLEASIAAPTPYVGQQDVYTLRLFYGSGMTGGQLQEPQANGAQLIHLNNDTRYQTQRNGRNYQVIERHYALIPQHAERIVVRGPTFMGQMLSSNGNDPFGAFFDDGTPVQARAEDITLSVRAIPANAGTPWLPAQSVQLQLTGLPANGRAQAGEPLSVTMTIDALGVSADRLPEPQLPPIDGARVYPDKTQDATRDDGHWLHGTRTRTFAIVPGHGGALTIPAITLNWWNVTADRAEQARVPAHTITVGAAATTAPGTPPPTASASTAGAVAASNSSAQQTFAGNASGVWWRNAAIASLALWLIALTAFAWWWVARRQRGVESNVEASASARSDARQWRQRTLAAARAGDVAACERNLLDWARAENAGVKKIGELRAALSDATQRDALDQLERARWRGGDARAASDAVTPAFTHGFAWKDTRRKNISANDGDLPPLYPSRD